MRLEVTAVRMNMTFWVLALCGHVYTCQHFGDTYYLHLQGIYQKNIVIAKLI